MKICTFCGETLDNDGVCPNINQHFKPMCLNCISCKDNGDNFICLNEENRIDAENKIKSTVGCGYEITSLTLSPLPLKNPTKNCKRYKINGTILIEQLSK